MNNVIDLTKYTKNDQEKIFKIGDREYKTKALTLGDALKLVELENTGASELEVLKLIASMISEEGFFDDIINNIPLQNIGVVIELVMEVLSEDLKPLLGDQKEEEKDEKLKENSIVLEEDEVVKIPSKE